MKTRFNKTHLVRGYLFVHIGNEKADVLYAGPQGTYSGLDQVYVRIWRMLAGAGETGMFLRLPERAQTWLG